MVARQSGILDKSIHFKRKDGLNGQADPICVRRRPGDDQ